MLNKIQKLEKEQQQFMEERNKVNKERLDEINKIPEIFNLKKFHARENTVITELKQNSKIDFIIYDFDDTLASITHTRSLFQGELKTWDLRKPLLQYLSLINIPIAIATDRTMDYEKNPHTHFLMQTRSNVLLYFAKNKIYVDPHLVIWRDEVDKLREMMYEQPEKQDTEDYERTVYGKIINVDQLILREHQNRLKKNKQAKAINFKKTLLVEDSESNYEKHLDFGGQAILVPKYKDDFDEFEFVVKEAEKCGLLELSKKLEEEPSLKKFYPEEIVKVAEAFHIALNNRRQGKHPEATFINPDIENLHMDLKNQPEKAKKTLEALSEQDWLFHIQENEEVSSGNTLLHQACYSGNVENIKHILNTDSYLSNFDAKYKKNPPLHILLENKNYDQLNTTVELFIEKRFVEKLDKNNVQKLLELFVNAHLQSKINQQTLTNLVNAITKNRSLEDYYSISLNTLLTKYPDNKNVIDVLLSNGFFQILKIILNKNHANNISKVFLDCNIMASIKNFVDAGETKMILNLFWEYPLDFSEEVNDLIHQKTQTLKSTSSNSSDKNAIIIAEALENLTHLYKENFQRLNQHSSIYFQICNTVTILRNPAFDINQEHFTNRYRMIVSHIINKINDIIPKESFSKDPEINKIRVQTEAIEQLISENLNTEKRNSNTYSIANQPTIFNSGRSRSQSVRGSARPQISAFVDPSSSPANNNNHK